VTRKVDIRIRKEEIRKAKLGKDKQNTEKGKDGVARVRYGSCL